MLMLQRVLFSVIVFLCLTTTVLAQESIKMDLRATAIGSDSLEVSLDIGSNADSLSVPIWAFEYEIRADAGIQFMGVDSEATLSAKEGWTVGANTVKYRALGFSSSRDAILTGGTLLSMIFRAGDDSAKKSICVVEMRLNTGNPEPIPKEACIVLQ